VNDEELYNEVRQYVELIAPESIKIVKHYKGTQPILDKYDITRQMKTGLGRIVGFKEGGYLVIDKTEALFSIDVNSGTKKVHEDQEENAFHFNMLAAEEIAHQLRLRDIGGIIIVDFIDMDSKEHQQQLYDKMKELMSRDRAKHNLLPLSKFGLMQITRQRVRPALEIDVMDTCPTCKGKGKVQPGIMLIDEVEIQLSTTREQYKGRLNMHLHPYVYSYVTRGWISSLKRKWNKQYRVNIIEDQRLNMLDVKYYDEKGEKVAVEGEKRL
jgi:ribonuclease G